MKTSINNWSEVYTNSFYELWNQVSQSLPNFALAIIIVVFGLIFAKLLSKLVKKLLMKLSETKLGAFLSPKSDSEAIKKLDFTDLFARLVYWTVVLFFLIVASNALGWIAVSKEIGALFRYIPKLLSGIVIVVIGLYIAQFVRESIFNTMTSLKMGGAKALSTVSFYILIIFITITALNQIGIDTEIINYNITIIITAILISFGIAFGFASRNVLESFISGTYNRVNLELGTVIRINDFEGVVANVDAVSFTLVNNQVKRVFPLKILTNTDYDIIDKN